ncbi:CinA family protein [Catenovulum sp. SM1970]|uniref:CinA family protein n=1 Tax=Marinifaba aquimaris TaxID=2741323 RepID=UPI001571B3A5|nr:CinA family protein [Marinifaba aquimaris]NTS78049.1 CinA family protein [Marinifaba aquimaris]
MQIPWSSIQSLSTRLGKKLIENNQTITTVESCTGGGIAYAITEIAGSSAYFNQGLVTYANDTKQKLAQVKAQTLEQNGAVSQATVAEMVTGACLSAGAQVGIATSGIAGPGGATATKPVGLVHFAFKVGEELHFAERVFKGDRASVRNQAIEFALKSIIELI